MNVDHYRGMAEHFRVLAELEPLPSLRRHLRRLAAQHDEMAADLEQQASPTIRGRLSGLETRKAASLPPPV